eukprot:TRINITY_DN12877_c0_g1_i4.p1 TRINITY_DN12877_c0_g1~~TRINITY_DN12877_c0_g1_i4.p1  ORF type:complete len:437 (+),score=134.11 TRINITY_DN12877_c0_g1_i4:112-1422(+)
MDQGLRTKAAEKLFGNGDTVLKDIIKVGDQYVFQLANKGKMCVLKGYKIRVESLEPGKEDSKERYMRMIASIVAAQQEYSFAKVACAFSDHFVRPLIIDYNVVLAKDCYSYSYLFIEIIFEYGGKSLDKLETDGIKDMYNLMRQSASAISVLHGMGVAHLNISPSKMLYNRDDSVLKLAGLRSSLECNASDQISLPKQKIRTMGYAAPEVILGKDEELRAVPGSVDVYAWAASFYSLLLRKSKEDLEAEAKAFSKEREDMYDAYLDAVRKELGKMRKEEPRKELQIMGEEILKGLSYRPGERPRMSEVSESLKNFERSENIKIPYAKIEKRQVKHVVKMLGGESSPDSGHSSEHEESEPELEFYNIFGSDEEEEKKDDSCDECMTGNNLKVKLLCGHEMCSACVMDYMLSKFAKGQKHKQKAICTFCKELSPISTC